MRCSQVDEGLVVGVLADRAGTRRGFHGLHCGIKARQHAFWREAVERDARRDLRVAEHAGELTAHTNRRDPVQRPRSHQPGQQRSGRIGEYQQVEHDVGVSRAIGSCGSITGPAAQAAANQVKAEQAAFDGAVPHRHAARLLEAHLAGELQVGREHPRLPADVVFLPMAGELLEEFAAIASPTAHFSSLAPHGLAVRALQGVATAQLHGLGDAGALGIALGEIDHTV